MSDDYINYYLLKNSAVLDLEKSHVSDSVGNLCLSVYTIRLKFINYRGCNIYYFSLFNGHRYTKVEHPQKNRQNIPPEVIQVLGSL